MEINNDIKEVIEAKIRDIESDYQSTKGLLLTEADLKCLLYSKLMEIPQFSERKGTEDNEIFSKSVHSEVRWYDENGKLSIIPDITVLDPEELSILHKVGSTKRLPSKQFEFGGNSIIFELKFVRNKKGITTKIFNDYIKKDFEKIERLFSKIRSEGAEDGLFCYFIIFNKTNSKCVEFDSFIQQNRGNNDYKLIYASGGVSFC